MLSEPRATLQPTVRPAARVAPAVSAPPDGGRRRLFVLGSGGGAREGGRTPAAATSPRATVRLVAAVARVCVTRRRYAERSDHPEGAPLPDEHPHLRRTCPCVAAEGPGRRFVCVRLDPHPDDYGADREGHVWQPASGQEWAVAIAALQVATTALRIAARAERRQQAAD